MDHFVIASLVSLCVIICTIVSTVMKFRRRSHFYEQASKFPGPPTLPIVGNAHLFIGNEGVLEIVAKLGKSYPAPYRVWLGKYFMIGVNTPEQLKAVLLSPKTIDKGLFLDFGRPWLGTGLLTASAAKWKVHRKLMQPTFNPTILQSFIGTFAARSAMMAKAMERNLDGPEFEIQNYTSECTLHTICETTMGVDLAAQTKDNGRYTEAVEKANVAWSIRTISPWLHPNFIFNRTQLGKEQQKYIKYLHNFTDNVIKTKRKELLEQSLQPGSTECEENDTASNVSGKKVLLHHLIEVANTNERLSDQALREEVDTIMVTGSETTACMSSCVMLMLSLHPDIQEKVYQELCEIYGDSDSEVLHCTPQDLTRMTYLERVIKETMRLFPLVPLLTRWVTEDLDIGEHTLPKGSCVVLSIMEIHRNGDYWPDPLKFDPDRFLPEEVKKRDSYAYLPFSGGPRSCIGSKYAMMSMKILLATILRKYILKKDTIKSPKDFRFKWEIILKPVDPITLKIERRTQKLASI